jgi:hypothetical protein
MSDNIESDVLDVEQRESDERNNNNNIGDDVQEYVEEQHDHDKVNQDGSDDEGNDGETDHAFMSLSAFACASLISIYCLLCFHTSDVLLCFLSFPTIDLFFCCELRPAPCSTMQPMLWLTVSMYAYTYVCMHVRMYVCMYVCMYECM